MPAATKAEAIARPCWTTSFPSYNHLRLSKRYLINSLGGPFEAARFERTARITASSCSSLIDLPTTPTSYYSKAATALLDAVAYQALQHRSVYLSQLELAGACG